MENRTNGADVYSGESVVALKVHAAIERAKHTHRAEVAAGCYDLGLDDSDLAALGFKVLDELGMPWRVDLLPADIQAAGQAIVDEIERQKNAPALVVYQDDGSALVYQTITHNPTAPRQRRSLRSRPTARRARPRQRRRSVRSGCSPGRQRNADDPHLAGLPEGGQP